MGVATSHSAEASALGFYFQSFFGLSALVGQSNDSAAVAIECADDVELKANSETLLVQLKHSMSEKPPAVTIASRALWRTLKVWIDLLPVLSLAQTRFQLVTVGVIGADSELRVLLQEGASRKTLVQALEQEASRVMKEREDASTAGTKTLPHADRADGCAAFLNLTPATRLNLLRRVQIKPGTLTIDKMEEEVAEKLVQVQAKDRLTIARSLIEWWDRQVVYSLCGKRPRFIERSELLRAMAERITEIEQDVLLPDFINMSHPAGYQPEGLLTRQIELVGGQESDIAKAIREEWRARQQRAKWVSDRPEMATTISLHDSHLHEEWSDRHASMLESCRGLDEDDRCASGLKLLRWSHDGAPGAVSPIAPGWSAAYYVRGSYQVLADDQTVGWHPDYRERLKDDDI